MSVTVDGHCPSCRFHQVRVTFAHRLWKSLFDASLSSDEVDFIVTSIDSNAGVPSSSSVPHIDQEVLLNILLDARTRVNARATKALADMFIASDVNGDGVLSLDEFTALIKHVRSDVATDMVSERFLLWHRRMVVYCCWTCVDPNSVQRSP